MVDRTSYHWGITSRPKQRQQIVLLSTGASLPGQQVELLSTEASLPGQDKGNISIVLLGTGVSLRGQNNGNQSYFLALGHHFAAKTTATNRTS